MASLPRSKRHRRSMQAHVNHKQDSLTMNKMRAMSTSTPIISHCASKMDSSFLPPVRSMSVSVCSTKDDSGYADSLMESDFSGYSPFNLNICQSDCKCSQHKNRQFETSICTNLFDESCNMEHLNLSLKYDQVVGKDDIDWDVSEDEDERTISENFQSIPSLEDESNSVDDGLGYSPDPNLCSTNFIERFDQVLAKFSPNEPDRLIGKKMGRNFVDIFSELMNRNMDSVVEMILNCLSPADLCSIVQVCQSWKLACDNNTTSYNRRQKYLKKQSQRASLRKKILQKENEGSSKMKLPLKLTNSAGGERKPLSGSVQLLGCDINPVPVAASTPSGVMGNMFVQAANSLKNEEHIQKCPNCRFPAKVYPVEDRGYCKNANCLFDFCINCFHEYHGARPCITAPAKRTKKDAIGSKKSKKNLKRL